jgi:hypothetical protein
MLYTRIFKLMNQNKVWKLETKFKSFSKSKTNLWLRNKNMHGMKCNPINLLFRLNALIGKF